MAGVIGKKFLIIFSLLVIATIGLLLSRDLNRKNKACFNNFCFTVDIAATEEERSRGLMFRKSMNLDAGMLFVFPEEGEYSFWMKNTLIPLDIIWIGNDNKVIYIGENIQPCRQDPCSLIRPAGKARYVLELNAGVSKSIALSVGDAIVLNFFK